jgi:hypothetical protein
VSEKIKQWKCQVFKWTGCQSWTLRDTCMLINTGKCHIFVEIKKSTFWLYISKVLCSGKIYCCSLMLLIKWKSHDHAKVRRYIDANLK